MPLDRRRFIERGAAFLLPLATILILTWPNLRGRYGIGTETLFDHSDPLFGDSRAAPARPSDDYSPVQVDWPRDRRLIERAREGKLDLWNPLIGNGAPLAPDPGGIFSPLRLVLYAAPLAPYTAFVLFRICKLLVAAAGAYLLARSHGLSRAASAVASVVFGASGSMISQLPFATVMSVCWLPWICWAQQRLGQRRSAVWLAPLALSVAATLTGGHQTIVLGIMMGAAAHALGVAWFQPSWRRRGHVALLLAAGCALGALLAGPGLLASLELVANGHSYKQTGTGEAFRSGSIALNRGLLFVGAGIPWNIDTLRDRGGGLGYPYILNFACGASAYLLAMVALVWRRWRPELIVLLSFGIIFCFQPPGFAWLGKLPFVKDILPRYAAALCVLPLAVAVGAGVDCLFEAARHRRGALFVPGARDATSTPAAARWPRGALTTTVLAAFVLWVGLLVAAALMTWVNYTPAAAAVGALLDVWKPGLRNAVVPAAAALAALAVAGVAAKRRWPWGRWFLAVAACVEAGLLALPHLREAPSRQLRAAPPPEAAAFARKVNEEHARVGGNSSMTIGWGGWPEARALAPIVPQRYARFIQAVGGSINFTSFYLPKDRSAPADLSAARYLMVPLRTEARFDGDPLVEHVRDLAAMSVYRNDGALPRARVVHRTIVARSIDDAASRLGTMVRDAPHVAGTPLADAAIIEPVAGAPPPRALEGGTSTAVKWVIDRPDDIVLQVDAAEPGYLILADTHYPGWKATVDGDSRPIYPANVGFRAVFVEAGSHRVALRFRPTSVRAGLACALAAALVLAVIVGRDARRQRRLAWRLGQRAWSRVRRRRQIAGAPVLTSRHDAGDADPRHPGAAAAGGAAGDPPAERHGEGRAAAGAGAPRTSG